MFAKVDVNGDDAAELYQWLKSEQPGEGESSDITWKQLCEVHRLNLIYQIHTLKFQELCQLTRNTSIFF